MGTLYERSKYGAIFDAHVHSCYDFHDGVLTPRELFKLSKKNGFNTVCAMSHDNLRGLSEFKRLEKEFNMPFIPAMEISTNYNHILAYGVQEWNYAKDAWDPDVVIERLREQDAAVYAAHPAIFQHRGKWHDLVYDLDFDGIEWTNGSLTFLNTAIHQRFKNYSKGRIAGTDAHHKSGFGFTYTQVLTSSADSDDIVAAMKKGQTRPGGRYVPLYRTIYWGILMKKIYSHFEQIHRVNGSIIKPQYYRRGILPYNEKDGREWKLQFKKREDVQIKHSAR